MNFLLLFCFFLFSPGQNCFHKANTGSHSCHQDTGCHFQTGPSQLGRIWNRNLNLQPALHAPTFLGCRMQAIRKHMSKQSWCQGDSGDACWQETRASCQSVLWKMQRLEHSKQPSDDPAIIKVLHQSNCCGLQENMQTDVG